MPSKVLPGGELAALLDKSIVSVVNISSYGHISMIKSSQRMSSKLARMVTV